MKRNKVLRYTIMMAIGAMMNLGFYQIAHLYHLPAWMDNLGSAYIALALEPTAGLLVAFATNFYQAACIYGSSSLIHYATSAMFALIIGIGMRKAGKIKWSRLPICLFILLCTTTFLAGSITLWKGSIDSGWEQTI